MKTVAFFLKRINERKSLELPLRIVSGVIYAAALGFFGYILEFGIPVTILLAAAGASLQFFFKHFKVAYRIPTIYHIISICISAYAALKFVGFVDRSAAVKTAACLSAAIFILAVVESVFGLAMKYAYDKEHPEHFAKSLLAVAPLLITTELYIPSETYFRNAINYLFVYIDFAPFLLIKTVIFTLAAALALCALKKKVFVFMTRLLAGLTLGVYCQYMFMNGDLPRAVGDPIDWDGLHTKMIVNAVIWAALLLVPFAVGLVVGRIKKLASNNAAKNAHIGAAAFIGGIQLLSIIMLIATSKVSLVGSNQYMLSNEEQFTVSSEKNVITFILDMADRRYFEREYERSPEKFEFLHDFTYYNNACMMFDATYISIPQMLSATTRPPEDNLMDWLEEVWHDEPCEEFYSRLHENNYKVNVFGDFCYYYYPLRDTIDNCQYVTKDRVHIDRPMLIGDLEQMSAFRYLPLGLKEKAEPTFDTCNRSVSIDHSCIMNNKEYMAAMDLKAVDDSNYFIVEHLDGTHGFTDTFSNEVLDCLELLDMYIDQLKDLGVYDDSVIIITADHGAHYKPNNMPIWYIKPAGAHNEEMQFCSAPIHHTDYAATILDTAGLYEEGDEELFGRSIYDIAEDEERERLVFQRPGFKYVGELDWQIWSDQFHPGAAFGYYFTGTREDLVEREEAGPPDILIELDAPY